ncbi:MAG: adenylosuccinate lyase [Ardenticatenales bacterium]|nr:adenylosuccinate lyase [Ardenticatenales bacterium]
MSSFDYNGYLSPLTWRYGSADMRQIWSEVHKRRLMRQVWLALATAQAPAGLVTPAQLAELKANVANIDIERSQQIEQDTRHDVMAEIKCYAEQCPGAGGIIHLGATSADITDNVDVMRQREGLVLLLDGLQAVLQELVRLMRTTADLPVMAHTHIQPAEPTTLGYRFAVYAQDLFQDWQDLRALRAELKGKGLKGAVGTQASYAELLAETDLTPAQMEAEAMHQLNLPYFPIATQTYSRQQDLRLLQVLAGLAASLHKFALDFRILQSPPFGEWAEPFGQKQVGSSAMPFKRNPINTENICSLARYVAGLPAMAWDNASQAILERSLDDSANRRLFLAEAFLISDELLRRTGRLLQGMQLDEIAMARNLAQYGPFAATERVMLAVAAAGGSRQEAHEWLRENSLRAWAALREGAGTNPLADYVATDERILAYLAPARIRELMDASNHTGTAAARALSFAQFIAAECA